MEAKKRAPDSANIFYGNGSRRIVIGKFYSTIYTYICGTMRIHFLDSRNRLHNFFE